MRVLFWGTPDFAVPTLLALDEEGHDIVGVVTQPNRRSGRGRKESAPPVKAVADEEGITVLQPGSARSPELVEELRALEPDVSVVVAYGQILPREVLDLPAYGSFNVHASLLPALRGAAPIQWAVLSGMDRTGVSIMRMEEGLDTGPVLFQVAEPIRPDESATELQHRLAEIGAEAMVDALAMLQADQVEERPQDHERATYAPKIDRDTARIDWARSAEVVGRWMRGMDETPGAWSHLGDTGPVKLFCPSVEEASGEPGTVLEADDHGVLIATGHGSVRVDEVQPPGKRRMKADEWVRGRGVHAGDRFR